MKFKFLNAALAGVVMFSYSFFANAGLISGVHTTNGGKVVALQGLEWMSLEHTVNMTRADVEDGFTDRYGTTWAAGEWEYATRSQTETLINSLWDGKVDGWSQTNHDGATWFVENFAGLRYDTGYGNSRIDGTYTDSNYVNLDASGFFFGTDGDCHSPSFATCYGYIQIADNIARGRSGYAKDINGEWSDRQSLTYTPNSGATGFFDESKGLNAGRYDDNTAVSKSWPHIEVGSLLVRGVAFVDDTKEVPEPSTLAIFALGMIGLASRRFKKQS